jgi:hypothetical protein
MTPIADIREAARLAAQVPACMGGWCRYREACALHLREDRSHVAERLCPKGAETPVPVKVAA